LDHRTDLPGGLRAADIPRTAQAQRIAQFVHTRAGESRIGRTGPGVGGDSVDIVGSQAGVGDGAQRGLDGEVESGPAEPPAHLRLPRTGYYGLTLERTSAAAHQLASCTGRNKGIQTSSHSSKKTSTSRPTATSAGSMSTILLTTLVSGCSASAMRATVYGGGNAGSQVCLFTV